VKDPLASARIYGSDGTETGNLRHENAGHAATGLARNCGDFAVTSRVFVGHSSARRTRPAGLVSKASALEK
jgi:hypothetical protein